VPSFILSGAPSAFYPKIGLLCWSLIGHLAP
jgi:hypothetical protein